MYYCTHCASSPFISISLWLKHLRRTHADDPNIIFSCTLDGCRRTFKKYTTFKNHVYGYHDVSSIATHQSPAVEESPQTPDSQRPDSPQTPDSQRPDSPQTPDSQRPDRPQTPDSPRTPDSQRPDSPQRPVDIKRAAALTLLKTREIHRIPISVMNEVIEENQLLFTLALNHLSSLVKKELQDAGVSSNVTDAAVKHLTEPSQATQLYHGLETEYKQAKYLRNEFKMIVSDFRSA